MDADGEEEGRSTILRRSLKLSWIGSCPCPWNGRIRRRRIPAKYDKLTGAKRVDVIQGFLNVRLMAAITVPWSGRF